MWVFIRYIPEKTSRKELNDFIHKGLRSGWMRLPMNIRGTVKRCEIMRIDDKDGKTTEFHGMVEIEPAKSGMKAIQRLDGNLLHGKPVIVRKYIHRSPHRDHRQTYTNMLDRGMVENRHNDRRRTHLQLDLMKMPKAEGVTGFNRTNQS
ncbi:MAG: RNA-binding protein [Gammaproteobacteria bacterium]|nr:RNA-binding protein [Gammaproteobacteria bacterium]